MNQNDLVSLYKKMKPLLAVYEKKGLTTKIDLDSRYDLRSIKKGITAHGKTRDEVAFAALIIQSSYVGFYFMPVSTDPGKSGVFGKELLSFLKGKSCFHIKKIDDTILQQIEDALAKGYTIYKANGWI